MSLEATITHANSSGWAITLAQHPDRPDYWEASLTRRATTNRNGIIRETLFAIADTPTTAIELALQSQPSLLESTGLSPAPPANTPSLLDLLAKAKPPTFTLTARR